MSKWKCKTPFCIKPCYAEPPENCIPQNCILGNETFPDWREEDEPTTTSSQLPKLTAEVFDRPDCPAWAKWAAVDSDGEGWFYEEKPVIGVEDTFVNVTLRAQCIDGEFDASDWQNSLIERPEPEFPEWCQKGKWVCTYDRFKKGWEYFKVNETKRNCISSDNGLEYSFYDLKQARVRPYNAEEMRGLIGKVLTSNSRSTPFSFLVVYAEGDGSFIESYRFKYTAEELKDHFTIDGKPCGVLEHLENGEWVR